MSLALGLAATAWAVVLFPLAIFLPIYSSATGPPGRSSIVHHYGFDVLAEVALPFLVCLAVLNLLQRHVIHPSRLVRALAWVLSLALLLAALVGFATFLIGFFVIPCGLLLVAGCGTAQGGSPPAGPRADLCGD